MKRNSRLALALHTLAHMAREPKSLQTSAAIADHAGTNPVVVRRVLGRLRDAGLLISEKGQAGGWRLAKAPAQLTLDEVYSALDEKIIASEDNSHSNDCSVESALYDKVTTVLKDAEEILISRLAETTISEVC